MVKLLIVILCLLPSAGYAGVAAVAGTWQPTSNAFARVSARQQALLGLPFAARIVALTVEPGAKVSAGEELARFDAPLLRQHLAAWQWSRQAVGLAQKRLQVLRESEQQHAITRRDVVAGEQAVAQAKSQSEQAWETLAADLDLLSITPDAQALETRLGKDGRPAVARRLGSLRAPFAGVVTQRRAALGEQLAAGEAVLELESLQRVYLDVGVPETALPFWRTGDTRWHTDKADVSLQPLDGAPLYDATTGLWLLRYEAENPGLALRDGAWVTVQHRGAPQAVVWVPEAAVVARNGKTWVVVQDGDSFKPVEVSTGAAVDGRVPVISGIAAGVEVITDGAYELLYRDLKDLIKFVD